MCPSLRSQVAEKTGPLNDGNFDWSRTDQCPERITKRNSTRLSSSYLRACSTDWLTTHSIFSTGTTPRNNQGGSGEAKNQRTGNVLIDRRIAELGRQGMITPFHPECVQPCSYDVHLGKNGLVETENGFRPIKLEDYSEEKPLLMPPGCFLLGETIEYFHIPRNVEAHLHLVSSRAREGLNHSLAGLVDCGYQGRLTLELKSALQFGHIPLYPGLRIGQLTFFEYMEDAENPYSGRYFGDSRVAMARDGEDLLRV